MNLKKNKGKVLALLSLFCVCFGSVVAFVVNVVVKFPIIVGVTIVGMILGLTICVALSIGATVCGTCYFGFWLLRRWLQ